MGKRVLGVLAGERLSAKALGGWLKDAEYVVAADAGAQHVLTLDSVPDVTLGDLDSLSEEAQEKLPKVLHFSDQNSSDCDKLLQFVADEGHDAICLVGCEGSRLDHTFGIFQSAARSSLKVTLALEKQTALVVSGPGEVEVSYSGLCSLIPLTLCTGVNFAGVQWPLSDAELSPLGLTSLSNESAGHVRVSIDSGAAALIIDCAIPGDWEIVMNWQSASVPAVCGSFA